MSVHPRTSTPFPGDQWVPPTNPSIYLRGRGPDQSPFPISVFQNYTPRSTPVSVQVVSSNPPIVTPTRVPPGSRSLSRPRPGELGLSPQCYPSGALQGSLLGSLFPSGCFWECVAGGGLAQPHPPLQPQPQEESVHLVLPPLLLVVLGLHGPPLVEDAPSASPRHSSRHGRTLYTPRRCALSLFPGGRGPQGPSEKKESRRVVPLGRGRKRFGGREGDGAGGKGGGGSGADGTQRSKVRVLRSWAGWNGAGGSG